MNDSGSASQGTNLSLCPFLTLESLMGPGGCGKSEARSRLNSCVIEFPHNTANVCMSAGTSGAHSRLAQTRAEYSKSWWSLHAVPSGRGTQKTWILYRQQDGGKAHTTKPDNPEVAALKQNRLASPLPPFSSPPPPVTLHICHPCARLPASVPCPTPGAGVLPETGICEATSSM